MVAARSQDRVHRPRGFILAEALVALLIFSVVFLALEGSLTLVVRRLAESAREDTAARRTETLRERMFAAGCATASGVDSLNAVVIDWTSTQEGDLVHVTQSSRYPRQLLTRTEQYDALSRCR